jgi:hypothetical protein
MTQVQPRFFISSVIEGFESFREAAAQGVRDAGAEPVMIEQFPSLSVSPRTACLDAIATCNGVVVIVGSRAGFKAPSGEYVVEEEWHYARKRATPLYVFVQDGPREPDAERIASEVSGYVHGRFRSTFRTPEELRAKVASALSETFSQQTVVPDTQMLTSALTKSIQSGHEPFVRLAIQPVRNSEIIDPLKLDSREFQDELLRVGTEGSSPLLSLRAEKTVVADTSSFYFEQPGSSSRGEEDWQARAQLSTRGFLVAERAAIRHVGSWRRGYDLGVALKLDDLAAATESLFQFAASLYNHVDQYIAYRDFVYGVSLVNLGMRYVYDVIPDGNRGVPIRMSDNAPILAFDEPRSIVREALDQPSDEIGRVVALIRRKAQI